MKNVKQIKKTKLFRSLSVIKLTIPHILTIIISIFFRLLPISTHKIVFSSFHGQKMNAQPLKVYDKLLDIIGENVKYYDIVWVLPKDYEPPANVRTVCPNSLRYIYELCTARCWIDNCRKDYWIKKRKSQTYIQTWHGPVCIKAIEKDAIDELHPYYVKGAIQDSKNADYIVAESSWRKNNIINSFWYDGKIIEGLFKKDINDEEFVKRKVKQHLKLQDNVKIVLYAPTFRKDEKTDYYLKQYEDVIDTLKSKMCGEWVFVVRLHPNIAEKADFINYDHHVVNGTIYQSIDELITASDIIITDYSGILFTAFQEKKIVILYAEDYDNYIKFDRNLYFELPVLPSPLVHNLDELKTAINNFSYEEYESKRLKLISEIGYYNTDAACLCANIIKNCVEFESGG